MHRNVAAGAAVVLLAASGCAAGAADGIESGEDYSVLGALAEVPADAGTDSMTITTGDLVSATEAADLDRPDNIDDTEAVIDWIGPLLGIAPGGEAAAVYVPMGPTLSQPITTLRLAESEDETGWSLLDVDAFVEVVDGSSRYLVMQGDFEAGTEYSGFDRASGAYRDGKVAVATEPKQVSAWEAEEGETLADHEALSSVAGALDEAGALSAFLAPGRAAGEAADPAVTPPPFAFAGIGWTQEGIVLIYHFPSAEDAEESVEVFRTQFAETPVRERLRLTDAQSDGPVAMLSVMPAEGLTPMVAYHSFQRMEPPFLHR